MAGMRSRGSRLAAAAALAAALMLVALTPGPAEAAPKLTVPKAELEASFKCGSDTSADYEALRSPNKTPVMFVTGTGFGGTESYLLGKGAFEAYGGPVCFLDSPTRLLGDLQDSVQHLVYGIRRMHQISGRKIAVLGVSQGGLLPRMALTYWPKLRGMVSDLVAVAGTQHGTTAGSSFECGPSQPCPAAYWQQARVSRLLGQVNSFPDETPGRTSYTTVRTLSDQTVRPVKRRARGSTSALRGASNVLIQGICPGRTTSHIGSAVDSVTFAAFEDAITHRGPAKRSRLIRRAQAICAKPYADGLNEAQTNAFLALADGVSAPPEGTRLFPAEPRVRAAFKFRANR